MGVNQDRLRGEKLGATRLGGPRNACKNATANDNEEGLALRMAA